MCVEGTGTVGFRQAQEVASHTRKCEGQGHEEEGIANNSRCGESHQREKAHHHCPSAETGREEEIHNFGGIWHTDTIYQSAPPMATILYALELPPIGGDTLFANQYLAYEQLSEGLKQTLESLKLVSRSDNKVVAKTRAARIKESGVKLKSASLSGCHPVIRTHPETGRKTLYLSPGHSGYFDGWSNYLPS